VMFDFDVVVPILASPSVDKEKNSSTAAT
jgi:hypothetical protein